MKWAGLVLVTVFAPDHHLLIIERRNDPLCTSAKIPPSAAASMVTIAPLARVIFRSEFLYAGTFTITPKARTVPVAIASFGGQTQFELPWGNRMAASLTITVPLILLVLFFQRKILAGLTAGAVKG